MPERVLVIGAGGFIGRALCSALLEAGYEVRAASRAQHIPLPIGVETCLADCKDPTRVVPLLKGCHSIVYLAATSTPGSSAGQALAELDGNLRPLLALLEALQSHPELPLLYFSSAGALYGDNKLAPHKESDLATPKSYHGASKVAAEYYIRAWACQYGGAATVLRPSNVYGPGQPQRTGFGIVPNAYGAMLRDEVLTVWGDGTAVRDYLYIDDLVALALASLKQPMTDGITVFNVASGEAASLNELFALMETVSGRALRRQYDRGRAVDADRMEIDCTAAHDYFNWTAHVSLADGLERTWRWLNTTPQ